MDEIRRIAEECGFECMGSCDAAALKTRPEVRDMCAADKCHAFGHSWACPPACGEIADFEAQMHAHRTCLVVQTVAQLEDEFDIDTMTEAAEAHKQRSERLVEALADAGVAAMVLTAGTCAVCEECTYPDAPCRFPERRFVSMEAAGLVVSEVCGLAGIPYNHGKNTLAYSSCVLSGAAR